MKYFGLPLLIALAGLALGHILRNALPRRQKQQIFWKKFGAADYFKAVLLTIAAIATGSVLGYLLLVKYYSPVNISLFAIACWGFGELYYSLKLFRRLPAGGTLRSGVKKD